MKTHVLREIGHFGFSLGWFGGESWALFKLALLNLDYSHGGTIITLFDIQIAKLSIYVYWFNQ